MIKKTQVFKLMGQKSGSSRLCVIIFAYMLTGKDF